MRKFYHLKYISTRIFVIAMVILAFFLIQAADQIYLLLNGRTSVWKALFYGAALLGYLAVSWCWVIIPGRQVERLIEHFLEGHIMPDDQMPGSVMLTPSMERQLEMMDRMLKSPQMIDLNKRQAQYLALQNQINPHFLYNTLESIRGEALIAGLNSVAEMTEALAKFFRYTITKVENLVTVEEELENCETYFRIQQYRFGDRLRLHIQCSEEDREEIMNCKIPKLTLQPILENSIIHGTELKIGTGNLKIQFETTEKRLIIRISDDGVGMNEELLAKLNRRLGKGPNNVVSSEEEQKGGIALTNVNNRIHLIFGEEYGMHIYSIEGQGTDVEITIPIRTGNERISRGMVS